MAARGVGDLCGRILSLLKERGVVRAGGHFFCAGREKAGLLTVRRGISFLFFGFGELRIRARG